MKRSETMSYAEFSKSTLKIRKAPWEAMRTHGGSAYPSPGAFFAFKGVAS